MKDLLAAFHRRLKSFEVKIIAFHEVVALATARIFHEALLACRKVIPAHDLMTLVEKVVGKVTSNESRSAGDKVFHFPAQWAMSNARFSAFTSTGK